ncbi:MAG: hypothetical protein NW226_04865 [Microscillaceae bacterium]|nr:hypothetical protein [Microscillaceae bacterium]
MQALADPSSRLSKVGRYVGIVNVPSGENESDVKGGKLPPELNPNLKTPAALKHHGINKTVDNHFNDIVKRLSSGNK